MRAVTYADVNPPIILDTVNPGSDVIVGTNEVTISNGGGDSITSSELIKLRDDIGELKKTISLLVDFIREEMLKENKK